MRTAILIVDDEELSRELLKQMFEDEYSIYMAENGREAIDLIGKHADELAAILLDLVMPVLNGYQVLQVLNAKKITDRVPVALITAQADSQVEIACYSLGASCVISKPYVAQAVRQHVHNIISIHQKALDMETEIEEQKEQIQVQQQRLAAFNDTLVEAVSNIVEFRDVETGQHIKRVKGFTRIVAQAYMQLYPESGLTRQKIDTIVRASALHDIGKIAIPDSILLKPGRLTDEEREIMNSHTTKGCEILQLLENVQDSDQYIEAYNICRHHHERDDGKGYPDGLAGEEIPLSARLVSLVDVYDALVSERIYKKPFDKETAYNMIMEGKCGKFAPKLLECFKNCRQAVEAFSDSMK